MNIQTRPDPGVRAERLLQPPESAIRSTFLPEERMRSLGELMARQKLDSYFGLTGFDFQARIREDAARILEAYKMLNAAQEKGDAVTPAAQWLLDNHYLVDETVFQIKRDLPRRFYSQLPTTDIGNGVQVPRVLALAWVYVAHCDSNVSSSGLKAIVDGYQSVQPLKIGELWALPSLLRFVLVENLRRLSARVRRAHEMRQLANSLADRVLAAQDGDVRTAMLAEYGDYAVDTTFATQMLYRLRDGSQNAGKALTWLESQLESRNSDAEETIVTEHRTLSGGNVTTGNIIRGLRLINDVDWSVWFETVSLLDAELREATDFAALDFQSRDQLRTAIETLARHSGKSEHQVAVEAIDLAKSAALENDPKSNVAYFLIGARRTELEARIGYRPTFGDSLFKLFHRLGWIGIMLPVLALTMMLLGMTTAALQSAGLSTTAIVILVALLSIPAGEGALSFFNTIALLLLKPTRLAGYEYRDGIPDEARTLVVVPTLISSRDDVEETVRNIEVHYLSNVSPNIYFAILSDWPDANHERSRADDELLDFARQEVAALNRRHPTEDGADLFHLIHRRRLFNPSQGVWMGWERKRGKLHELDLLLRGDSDTTMLPLDRPLPTDVVHVMTLDADTKIMRDAVADLVGKLMHPMNKPSWDAAGRVTDGYSILQPRVTASLTTGNDASFFQRVFSASRGIDPYVFAVSDLYQDLFNSGTFTGKGLYHIDAMEAAMRGKLVDNAVLSHDLLEGALARCALVTDVEVVEDYPTRYLVDASRQHRWARGDWQLLPMIFDPKLAIPGLSRWKMIDNLRRSITPIFWVLAAIAGWTLMPFYLAAQWMALLILSQFMAATFNIVNALTPKSREITFRGHFTALARDVAYGTALVASKTVFTAHSAWMMGDAIVRTLYRLLVSRKNLLEWRTASQASRAGGSTIEGYYRLMWGAVVIAIVGLVIPLLVGSTGVGVAALFAVFWAGSPIYAFLVSRSAETQDKLVISRSDTVKLRNFARRTWHYFETFVTPEHSFLPPDNFQENPHPVVAGRTSPTNIGVYLLSVVSARDFGWIGMNDAVERLEATMATLERMERYRGHLYNWYDTRTLMPLRPLYVSAVDSGNLAGHLIAVAAACHEWSESPSVYLQADFAGMLDVLDVLEHTLQTVPDDRRPLRPLRQRLQDRIAGMRRSVEAVQAEPELASILTLNLAVLAAEIHKLAEQIHHEVGSDQTQQLADWGAAIAKTAEAHVGDAHSDKARVDELRQRMHGLRDRMRKFALEMEFSFLLNRDRKLLSIGYRVDERQLDQSCYDLLASECRLTSLLAIAKGDIPTDHWFRLGRPIVEIGFSGALMSWSGSMFEYLMPPLVMKEPQGGILNQTDRMIIHRQIEYGDSKGIPWGISEAAYNARDHEMTYQYTNFGVPGLGLKRGLAQNTVIAPYATILAAQYYPDKAVQNLERLISIGALGRYGFYDAVDFTPQRVPEGQKCAVVYNYMAHHSGMSIVAIANAVFEGRMRDRFHSDPVVEAAELLLQEKAPRDIPIATVRSDASDRIKIDSAQAAPDTRMIVDPTRSLRSTCLLSNGGYSIMLTATGSGVSRWGDLSINRWQPDPVEDRLGTYVFLRDLDDGQWWSATALPKSVDGERTETYFSDDKAHFVKQVGKLRSELRCIVVSEGQRRRRAASRCSQRRRRGPPYRGDDFAELVIGPEAADNAHPAFSKMFVETEIARRQQGTIYAYAAQAKRPRA
jgi:cyclic beta-1,2-glucan synthetase